MTIAIFADTDSKAEILEKGFGNGVEVIWTDSVRSLVMVDADFYFDLHFENDPERIARLKTLFPRPVFINAVSDTLRAIGEDRFIRMNAWHGMINRPVVEIAFDEANEHNVEAFKQSTGWKFIRVNDITGLVTPRVVAMIINEAYFALGEEVSSKEQIDMAMKAGTNYPYGPFEWAVKIGHTRVVELLTKLHKENSRYELAPALLKESNSGG
jgi:3-hydroxybutyryl-CoA dehydrogenase